VTARLVSAEAPDTDGGSLGNARDEFYGLTAGGVGEEFALVAVEEFLAFLCFFGMEFEDLGDEFGFWSKRGKPNIEVAVNDPAVLGHSAGRVAGDADAQALIGLGRGADLEGGEVQFRFHGAYPFERNQSMAARMAG